MKKLFSFFGAVTMWLTMTVCAHAQPLLYRWDSYPQTVYDYFKTDENALEEQITQMKRYFEQLHAKGISAPPTAHAHLGGLLLHVGQVDLAVTHFSHEKRLFPESAEFMNFMIRNARRSKK